MKKNVISENIEALSTKERELRNQTLYVATKAAEDAIPTPNKITPYSIANGYIRGIIRGKDGNLRCVLCDSRESEVNMQLSDMAMDELMIVLDYLKSIAE